MYCKPHPYSFRPLFYVHFVEKKSQCLQIKYQNGSRNCKKFSRLISNPFLSPKKRNKKYFLKKVDYEIIFKINCLHLENLSFLVWTAPVVDLLDVSLPVVVSRKRFSALLTAKRFHAYKARHFVASLDQEPEQISGYGFHSGSVSYSGSEPEQNL